MERLKLVFSYLDDGSCYAEVLADLFSERMIVSIWVQHTLRIFCEAEFLSRVKRIPPAKAKMLRPLLTNWGLCYDDKESTRLYIPHSLMNYACIAEDAVLEKTEDGCFILRNS
mgnify:CR=1 FL=1